MIDRTADWSTFLTKDQVFLPKIRQVKTPCGWCIDKDRFPQGKELTLSNTLNGSLDDVVLGFSADVHKMSTVAGHPNDDLLVFFRVFLSGT